MLKVRTAEIVEVDPVDGEMEIWFHLENNYQDFFILKVGNDYQPQKILKAKEISDEEIKLSRMKSLEREMDSLFKQITTLTKLH